MFIIGHWRTGTTLLHELLSLDERHVYPTYLHCFAPDYFLIFRSWVLFFAKNIMGSKRPMDQMKTGWDLPQEDEFGLMARGVPSPYWNIAFPKNLEINKEYLTLENVPSKELKKWKKGFLNFLRSISFKNSKRLILKSPTHSFKIKFLLELFPDAKFIHIIRNPYEVFPSTIKLWKSLQEISGYQKRNEVDLNEYVFKNFNLLYEKIEEGRSYLKSNQFIEIKYEDLIQDPIEGMENIYNILELGEFDSVKNKIKKDWEARKGYKVNRFKISPEVSNEITKRWGRVIDRYGYTPPLESASNY
ncbi:MAG: sulfotransferase [bacterium]|nr:sulfotransferase [bacterium]